MFYESRVILLGPILIMLIVLLFLPEKWLNKLSKIQTVALTLALVVLAFSMLFLHIAFFP